MSDEQLEKYKREYEGYSQDELREELFRLTMETPDSQIEGRDHCSRIDAICSLLEVDDATPVDTEASYNAFQEKHAELLEMRSQIPITKHPGLRFPFKRILLVASLAVLLIGSISVYAYRLEILNWFETTHEKYTELQTDDPAQTLIEHWHGCYIPAYIPEGYSLVDVQFEVGKEKMLTFYQYSPSSSIQLDTEDV